MTWEESFLSIYIYVYYELSVDRSTKSYRYWISLGSIPSRRHACKDLGVFTRSPGSASSVGNKNQCLLKKLYLSYEGVTKIEIIAYFCPKLVIQGQASTLL